MAWVSVFTDDSIQNCRSKRGILSLDERTCVGAEYNSPSHVFNVRSPSKQRQQRPVACGKNNLGQKPIENHIGSPMGIAAVYRYT